jgi:hypothetical protein
MPQNHSRAVDIHSAAYGGEPVYAIAASAPYDHESPGTAKTQSTEVQPASASSAPVPSSVYTNIEEIGGAFDLTVQHANVAETGQVVVVVE